MNKPKLKDISHLRGLSGQILFAVDTENAPGKAICHFVRLETIAFDDSPDFDQSTFTVLHPDADPRLASLGGCFTGGVVEPVKQCADMAETLLTDPKLAGLPAWAKLRLGLLVQGLRTLQSEL